MGAVTVEAVGVGAGLGVLHFEQLAGVAEGPAVERASKRAFVALFTAAEHRATVGAGVDQAVQRAVFVAGDDHGLAADPGGEVVVDLRHLAFVRQVDPTAFENVLHFQGKQVGVGEDVAAAAEHPSGGIFLDGVAQLSGESVECADHGVGPRLFLYQAPPPYVLALPLNIR